MIASNAAGVVDDPLSGIVPDGESETDRLLDGSRPEQSGKIGWLDLAIMAVLAAAGALMTGAPLALRIPIGLLSVILVPGYALVSALLPSPTQVDRIERIGMGLGLSFAMVTVQAVLLDRMFAGITPDGIREITSGTALFLLVVAVVRRAKSEPVPTPATPRSQPRVRASRAVRFTQAILVANLVMGGLAYAVTVGPPAPRPAEFYVLGAEGTLGGYPRQVQAGELIRLRIGGRQGESERSRQRVETRRGESVLTGFDLGTLTPGQAWEQDLEFRLTTPGLDQAVTILLFRNDEVQPYRTLRLFVDVLPAGGA